MSTPRIAPPALDLNHHALFLDLDGTLLELQERPHAVLASPELRHLLRRLSNAMSGAFAIVTGRTLADADAILEGAVDYAAGVHGIELQRGARITRDEVDLSRIAAARTDIRKLLQSHQLPALVEDKRASLALHYRHAPESGEEVKRIAADIAARRGLRLLHGKMVVELMASPRTKGYAVTVFMAAAPFAGRIPIAIGDDRTDEDAFAAAKRLGGFGILAGVAHASQAEYALAGPAAVIAWLESGLRA